MCVANHKYLQEFVQSIQKNEVKTNILKERYIMTMKERCGEFIFRNTLTKEEVSEARNVGPSKQSFAKRIRKKSYFQCLSSLNL
jgi:hypothetical protein